MHAFGAATGGAIMMIWGRGAFESFFGFTTGIASVFVKRHGFLVFQKGVWP